MKFLKEQQVSHALQNPHIFSYSKVYQVGVPFIFLLLSMIGIWIGFKGGFHYQEIQLSAFSGYVMAGLMGFTFLIFLPTTLSVLKSRGWLIQYALEGIAIHYRSTYNGHFPKDVPTVVLLEPSEIEWIRIVKERRKTYGAGGSGSTQHKSLIYIDFKLNTDELNQLKSHLHQEYNVIAGKQSFKYNHYPVQVINDQLLRVEYIKVNPSPKKLTSIFNERFAIEDPIKYEFDGRAHENLGPDEKERKIKELIMRGEKMEAIKFATVALGISTQEAHKYIGKLSDE